MPDPFDRRSFRRYAGMDDAEYDAARREDALAWAPETDAQYRGDEATRAASTGELYDPTQNPATRRNAMGGSGDNEFNYTNRAQQILNRGMYDYANRDEAAAASRTRADEAATGRPTYQIPTYTMPGEFAFDQQRTPLQTDQDIADRYRGYGDLVGVDNTEGIDYEAERVGDYGQAFNTWLTGAQSSFGKRLQEESNLLRESAAARGRLNTGFYDEDVGTLQRNIAGDFSDAAQMAALDAAGLSLRGAEGNADRALSAARLRGERSDVAYGNRLGLLDRSMDRSAYLDQAGDARYEDDRNFDYGVYSDARDFGRDTFEDDRNFGYGAFRDSNRDFENDRDFFEDRYRFDEGEADDARNFYADYNNGLWDRRVDRQRYEDAQPSGFEKFVGTVAPIAGTVVGGLFGGPAGAAAGASAGAAVGGKGGGTSPEGLPVSRYSATVDTPAVQDGMPEEDEGLGWYEDYVRRNGR